MCMCHEYDKKENRINLLYVWDEKFCNNKAYSGWNL